MSQLNIFSAQWRDINISDKPPPRWVNYRLIWCIISRLISYDARKRTDKFAHYSFFMVGILKHCFWVTLPVWRLKPHQPMFLQGFFPLWMRTVEPKGWSAAGTTEPSASFQAASAQITFPLSRDRYESGTLIKLCLESPRIPVSASCKAESKYIRGATDHFRSRI